MIFLKISVFLYALNIWIILPYVLGIDKYIPVVVTTWDFKNATKTAWNTIYRGKGSSIDAIEAGCNYCEETQCRETVGFGGSPDENGETTLDAMLMDGTTMDVGGVGGLRHVKRAISVARHVLENTEHSLIVGELATEFALKLGFLNESLITEKSHNVWKKWRHNNCQPNFWKNVTPNPFHSCGPYQPKKKNTHQQKSIHSTKDNHDTIGMLAIDMKGRIAAGTSTNGAKNKIAGRVGDSPIAGAGAYADQEIGAAACTGDGDIMMRFLPSFLVVELMGQGVSPTAAAEIAIKRIVKHYPKFSGAIVALNKKGHFGAACNGFKSFPYYASNIKLRKPTIFQTPCLVNYD